MDTEGGICINIHTYIHIYIHTHVTEYYSVLKK